jgi:hypothetical protein
MSSSSSSAVNAPSIDSSSKDMLSDLVAVELQPGHMVEFGVSRISSVRVQDVQQLGYFGNGVGRVQGAEEIPEPEGELVVFGRSSSPAFAYLRIVSWQRSCRGLKFRSTN